MPETTPLIKAALNLRVGAGFDVYVLEPTGWQLPPCSQKAPPGRCPGRRFFLLISFIHDNRMLAERAFYCFSQNSSISSPTGPMINAIRAGREGFDMISISPGSIVTA